MKKKYLSKNEFRMDLNTKHQGKNKEPHPAYITAKYGNKFKANNITHSEYVNGVLTKDLGENVGNKKDSRNSRVTAPYWQNRKKFGQKMKSYKISNRAKRRISRFNRKFK